MERAAASVVADAACGACGVRRRVAHAADWPRRARAVQQTGEPRPCSSQSRLCSSRQAPRREAVAATLHPKARSVVASAEDDERARAPACARSLRVVSKPCR
eukprot:2016460-Pleurochrysis_carterae.AAC.1